MRRGGVGAAFPAVFCRIFAGIRFLRLSLRAVGHEATSLRMFPRSLLLSFIWVSMGWLIPWWWFRAASSGSKAGSRVFSFRTYYADHSDRCFFFFLSQTSVVSDARHRYIWIKQNPHDKPGGSRLSLGVNPLRAGSNP